MKGAEKQQLSFFEKETNGNCYQEICEQISDKGVLSPDEFGKALKNWARKTLKQPINIVALFSGAGGLDIGFCDAGFTLIESVELEEKFVQTMQHNQSIGKYFSKANILAKDIRQYEPNISTKIDFIIGGPPCQSFSAAGRRAAGVAGTKDDRGSLFEEYVRSKNYNPKDFCLKTFTVCWVQKKANQLKKLFVPLKKSATIFHIVFWMRQIMEFHNIVKELSLLVQKKKFSSFRNQHMVRILQMALSIIQPKKQFRKHLIPTLINFRL
jgi:DNA (cytosine-5)-methyltransferase 1